MRVNNEQGLTLIELLAAIAISTIILGLVSTVLMGSINDYNKALTYSNLRQEANLVIVELTEVHHQYLDYSIGTADGLIKVSSENQSWTIGNPAFMYEIEPKAISKSNDYLNVKLTITDPDSKTPPYNTSTIINRR